MNIMMKNYHPGTQNLLTLEVWTAPGPLKPFQTGGREAPHMLEGFLKPSGAVQTPKIDDCWAGSKAYKFIRFGAIDVTKPCNLIGFGAMDVTKACTFIWFGAMDVTKPYKFIGAINLRVF
jgi:hypothetical protein